MHTIKMAALVMALSAPVFSGEIRISSLDVEADRAVSVTGAQSNRIEAAFGWGNHGNAGYLLTESDPGWSADKPNYATKADVSAAATNEAALRLAAVAPLANTQQLTQAIAALTTLTAATTHRLVSADSNWWVSVESGTATLWRVTAEPGVWRLVCDDLGIDTDLPGLQIPLVTSYENTFLGYPGASIYVEMATESTVDASLRTWGWADRWGAGPVSESPISLMPQSGALAQNPAYLSYRPVASTNVVGTYVKASDLASAIAAATAPLATTQQLAQAIASAADTCPPWLSAGLLPTTGGTQYPTLSQTAISLANNATSLWFVIPHPAPRSHMALQLQAYATSAAAATNPVSVYVRTGGYGDLAAAAANPATTICHPATMDGIRATNIVFVAPSAAPTYAGAFIRVDLVRPNTLASGSGVTLCPPFWRCATSNEVATQTFAQ